MLVSVSSPQLLKDAAYRRDKWIGMSSDEKKTMYTNCKPYNQDLPPSLLHKSTDATTMHATASTMSWAERRRIREATDALTSTISSTIDTTIETSDARYTLPYTIPKTEHKFSAPETVRANRKKSTGVIDIYVQIQMSLIRVIQSGDITDVRHKITSANVNLTYYGVPIVCFCRNEKCLDYMVSVGLSLDLSKDSHSGNIIDVLFATEGTSYKSIKFSKFLPPLSINIINYFIEKCGLNIGSHIEIVKKIRASFMMKRTPTMNDLKVAKLLSTLVHDVHTSSISDVDSDAGSGSGSRDTDSRYIFDRAYDRVYDGAY
jgi:hypothetical protein